MSTSVLCLDKQSLPKLAKGKTSYTPFNRNFSLESFSAFEPWFVPRSYAETCSEFLQVIPYIHVIVKDKVLSYSRGGKGSENRLHNKRSIGFGGHVELYDAAIDDVGNFDFKHTINNCITRELVEELGENEFNGGKTKFMGVLYDPTTEVGKVHLGISIQLTIDHIKVVGEHQVVEKCDFSSFADLKKDKASYETWSGLVLDELFAQKSDRALERA